MDIKSDAEGCECSRNEEELRFFQGWGWDWWHGETKYWPTFFDDRLFQSLRLVISLSVPWFLVFEGLLVWLVNPLSLLSWGSMFVLGLSVVSFIVAIGAAVWTRVVLDVLCHIFIGRSRYCFLDQKGGLHVHRWNPVYEYAYNAFCDYGSWETFLYHHPIFKVRSGGIFRWSKVMRHGGSSWKMSVGLFGKRIVVTDPDGSAIGLGDRPADDPGLISHQERMKKVLRFVAKHKRVNDGIVDLEQQKESVAAFDALGSECAELIRLMEASKQTMGRSKHAQLLRERLEAIFEKMPEDRVKAWKLAISEAETKRERESAIVA